MIEKKVSDEMLMAYADGELEGAERDGIARLAETDPVIAARIARFSSARRAVHDAYAPIMAQPVPEALIAALSGGASTRTPPRQDNGFIRRFAMPAAASLILAVGLGGYWLGLSSNPPGEPSFIAIATGPSVLDALAGAPSGEPVHVMSGNVSIQTRATGTYEVADGLCRIYEASSGGDSLRGVTCTDGTHWSVPVAMTGEDGAYRPAQDADTAIIDVFLDSVAAGADIGPEAEAELIARGWQ